MRKYFLVVFLLVLLTAKVRAQTDTAFWFAVPEASAGHGDSPISLKITSQSSAATVKVYVPANSSITPITVSLAANSVSTIDLSAWKESLENKPANTVLNNGLKIEASTAVTAYFEEASTNNPEIYSLKGSNAVGKLFYVPGQTSLANESSYSPTPYNSFDIVATEDNTVVTITPKQSVVGHTAGVAYTVTLNKGQTYSAWAVSTLATGHLGGSKISSTKPVAVTFKDDSVINGSCRDLGGDQIVPVEMLGQEYIAINGFLTTGTDIASIMAVQNGTVVSIDGVQVATLNEGETYQKSFSNNPIIITSTKPISVLHITGRGCELGYAMLPQIGCNGSNSVGINRPGTGAFSLFVLCQEGSQGGFLLNGNSALIKASDFKNLTGSWRYAQVTLSTTDLAAGASALVTNSSGKFHLGIVYGNASDGVSYGYFSNFASATSTISYNSPVCTGGTINFTCNPNTTSTGLIYEWTGPNNFTSSVQNPSISNATAANSGTYYCKITNQGCFVTLLSVQVSVGSYPTAVITTNGPVCAGASLQVNGSSDMAGATYAWSGPNSFTSSSANNTISSVTVAAAGSYSLSVTKDGCSTSSSSSVTVNALPDATITGSTAICAGGSLTLTSPNVSGVAYSWTGPNSFTNSTASIVVNNFGNSSNGTYSLTAIKSGCSNSSSVATTLKSLPVAQISGTNNICENQPIALTATDAGIGATYAWSGPSSFSSASTAANISTAALNNAGTYNLTVSLNGCSSSASQNVTVKSLPVAQINGVNAICENQAINLSATDAGIGATYAWSGPSSFSSTTTAANIATAALNNGGTYNLTVSLNGCSSSASQNVTVKPLPVAQITGANTICENQAINLTASDAGVGATYAWSGPSSFSSATTAANIATAALNNAGTYNLTVSLNGCSSSALQNVTVKPLPVAQISGTNNICENQPIALTATDAGVGATYAWSGPSSFSSATTAANIATAALNNGGTYNLTVSLNGCSSSASQNVTVKPLPVAQITGVNTVCENQAINLTASDAGIGATYAWSGPSSFSSATTAANIATAALNNGGTYNLTVSLNGCSSSASQNVTVKPLPVAQITGVNTICENQAINLTASDAGIGATYAWSGPSSFSSTSTAANIVTAALNNGGTYNLIVSLNGCSSTASQNVTVKPLPVAQINGVNAICENQAINLTASDAGIGATYAWSGPSSFSSSTTAANISTAAMNNAGIYNLTVSLNGCSSSASQNVTVKPLPVAQITGVNTICENQAISLMATDAGIGATYAWSGPSSFSSTSTAANIATAALNNAGTYNLTVSLNGCSSSASQNVTVKPLPVAQINGVNAICENQAINLTASDAGIGATYAWSGPSSFSSLTTAANIATAALNNAGTYNLTVSLNGCSSSASQNVTVKPLPVAQMSGTNDICENQPIALTATDAGVGATYAWSGPASFSSSTTAANIATAALNNGGTYNLTVSLNGCSSSASRNVTVKSLPVAQITGVNTICENQAINLTASDAGVGATYAWSGPASFSSSTTAANIATAALNNGGIYNLTVSLNGCSSSASQNVTVKPLPVAQINGVNVICENQAINLSATDAGIGATYAWSGPSSFSSTTTVANIAIAALNNAGTYNLSVSLNGCSSSASQNVTVKPLPVAQITGVNTICENQAINLTATDAGVGATYAWSGPSSFSSATTAANIATAALNNGGTYNLTVSLNGCSSSASQNVTVKPLPVAQITGVNTICENQAINLTASDAGVGATYAWSGPSSFSSTTTAANIATAALNNGGTYNLIVSLNGCSSSASQNVTVKPLPVAQISGVNTICENQAINLTASDAGIGATYAWSGPSSFSSSTTAANIVTAALNNGGTYNLTVSLNGCSSSASQNVTVKPLPVAQITGVNTICENQAISLTASDAGVGATYAWSGPSSFSSSTTAANIATAALNNSGTYNLIVSLNGCSSSASQNVTVKPLPVTQITGVNTICENQAINLTASDAGIGATYAWSGPSSFSSATTAANIATAALNNGGTYNLTVSLNGCSSSASQNVTVKPLPVAQITGVNTICENQAINLSASDAGIGASYAWSGPSSFSSTTNAANITSAALNNGGTYNLTVSLNGCSSSASQNVTVKPLPVAQITGVNTICENQAINLTASDAGVGATYAWSGPSSFSSTTTAANMATAALNNGGTYNLTVTVNGCSSSASENVMVRPLPTVQVANIVSVCELAPLNIAVANVSTDINYNWQFGAQNVSSGSSLAINSASLSHAGLYTVVAELNGCISSVPVEVRVKPLVKAVINGTNSVCEKSSIELSVADQGQGVNYVWSGPANFTASEINVSLKNVGTSQSGTYAVTMIRDGCQSTSTIDVEVKVLPKVNFSGRTELCEGEALSLTADNAGTDAQYAWENENGNVIANGASFMKSAYSLTDDKNIYLTVVKNGCANRMKIGILAKALPAAAIQGSGSFCEGTSISLEAADAGADADYTWETPENTTDNTKTLKVKKLHPSQAGNYTLTVQKNGCVNKAVANLKIKSLPQLKFSGTTNVCENSAITLSVKDQDANASYEWKGPSNFDAKTASIQIAKATLAQQGAYAVQITRDGCSVIDSIQVKVKPLPSAVIAGANTVCEKSTIALEATNAPAGSQFVWSGPSGVASTGKTLTIQNAAFANEGDYQLSVINDGCSNVAFTTVKVKPLPIAQIKGEVVVCENSTLELKAADAGKDALYNWSDPAGNGVSALEFSVQKIQLQNAGVYKLTVSLNNCTVTEKANVVVKALPIVQITGAKEICENEVLELKGKADADVKYEWSFNNSVINTAEAISINKIQLIQSGAYTLKAEKNGCYAEAVHQLTVKALPVINISGANDICERSELKLYGNADADKFSWTKKDATVSGNQNLYVGMITKDDAGEYIFSAVKNGCAVSKNINVTVRSVTAKIAAKQVVCENDVVELNAADAGETATYQWNGPAFAGNKISELLPPVKPNQSGAYVLTVEKDGCINHDTLNLIVKSAPLASVQEMKAFCENDEAKIAAVKVDNASYTWQQNNGNQIQGDAIQFAKVGLQNAGIYKLTVTVNGCSASTSTELKVKPLPNAKIMGNEAVCEGTSLQFLAESAGANAVYSWTLPGNNEVSGTSLKIAPIQLTNTGLYKLNVMVDGCSSSSEKYLKVTPRPDALVYGKTSVCEGESLQLSAGDAGDNATYKWIGPDGNVVNAKEVSVSAIKLDQTGGYTLSVSKNGCTVNTTANVIVKKLPVATIDAAKALCEGEILVLKANSADAVENFEWSGPTVINTIGSIITIDNVQAVHTGTYQLRARMSGCESVTTQYVKIKALPRPIIKGANKICEGSVLQLTGADEKTVGEFTWMTPDNKVTNGQTITIANASAANGGLYKLKVLHEGCVSYDSLTVQVNQNPLVQIQPTPDVCQFTPAFIVQAKELKGLKGAGVFSGAVISASGEVVTHKTGSFDIQYSFTTIDGCSATTTSVVKVNPGITVNAGMDVTQYEDEGVQLNAMVSGSYKQLTWSNIAAGGNVINPVVRPSNTTTYTVNVVNEFGCSAKDEVTVKVVRMKIPNAFSPNNDGINDRWEVEPLKNYPSCRVEIFNRAGQSIFMSKGYGVAWDGKINGQQAPEGTYYYVINVNDGKERKPISGWLQIIR